MKFVTPDNELVKLDHTGDIYCINNDNVKIARFTGVHPLVNCVEKFAPTLDLEESELPTSWDAWEILMPIDDNFCSILQRAIAAAFASCEVVDRIIEL